MGQSKTEPMVPNVFSVKRIKRETKDTFTLQLDSSNSPFSFLPGQFNMLYVHGVGEVPISISGDPTTSEGLEHTTRIVGTVTKSMGHMKAGDKIGLRGPFGSAWPIEKAYGKDVVFVAGGIGLAPLRPAIYQLLKERQKFNKVVILYGTRSPEDILFQKDLELWESKFDITVIITVDRAMDNWNGNVGVVTKLIPRAPFLPDEAVAYLCGPEIMMYYTVDSLVQRGLTEDNIFVSMERNMKCAVAHCGRCQYGPNFICKDGPVFNYTQIKSLFRAEEV